MEGRVLGLVNCPKQVLRVGIAVAIVITVTVTIAVGGAYTSMAASRTVSRHPQTSRAGPTILHCPTTFDAHVPKGVSMKKNGP